MSHETCDNCERPLRLCLCTPEMQRQDIEQERQYRAGLQVLCERWRCNRAHAERRAVIEAAERELPPQTRGMIRETPKLWPGFEREKLE